MTFIQTITLAFLASATVFAADRPTQPTQPTPVQDFEVERYMGLWNQLSAVPAIFQSDCVANTTAEYTLLRNGLVKVVNSCDQANGDRDPGEARARVNQDFGLASTLEVTFVNVNGQWIWQAAGDYWVIYISEEYDTAIVGHPAYEFGWILSRKETLSLAEYSKLNDEINSQGYDSCKFMMSTTPSQKFDIEQTLCEYVKRKH